MKKAFYLIPAVLLIGIIISACQAAVTPTSLANTPTEVMASATATAAITITPTELPDFSIITIEPEDRPSGKLTPTPVPIKLLSFEIKPMKAQEIINGDDPNSHPESFPGGIAAYGNINEIVDMKFDSNGLLWSVGPPGLVKWDLDNNQFWMVDLPDGVATAHTRNGLSALEIGSDDSIWIGTHLGEIWRMKDGDWINYLVDEIKPSMDIRDIYEDQNGNVWFATYGAGVVRFDGENWRVFLLEDGLASVAVSDIAEADDGTMYFASHTTCCMSLQYDNVHEGYSNQGGISVFDGQNWMILDDEIKFAYDEEGGWAPEITTIGNDLWISFTFSNRIIKYSNDQLTNYFVPNLVGSPVHRFDLDGAGNLWASFRGWNLLFYDGENWYNKTFLDFTEKDVGLDRVRTMAFHPDHGMCLGSYQGLSCINDDEIYKFPTYEIERYYDLFDVADFTAFGNILSFAGFDDEIVIYSENKWQIEDPENQLTCGSDTDNPDITNLGAIRVTIKSKSYNNIDISNLFYCDGNNWTILGQVEYFEELLIDSLGNIWLLYDLNKLIFINGNNFDLQEITVPRKVLDLIISPGGTPLIRSESDVFTYDDNLSLLQISDEIMDAIAFSPDGTLWGMRTETIKDEETIFGWEKTIGFQIFQFQNSEFVLIDTIQLEDEFYPRGDFQMIFTEDGTLWIGGADEYGVYAYKDGEVQHFNLTGNASDDVIFNIFITPDGLIWFVTERGLVSVDYKLLLGE